MQIDFTNIGTYTITPDRLKAKWRFINDMYGEIPDEHLDRLKSLNEEASRFLWDFLSMTNLHEDIPFKRGFFQIIEKEKILDDNQQEIKKWLFQRGLPFEREVFVSWQSKDAMIVPWKLLLKYFDHFSYADFTIFEQSLQWAILFYQEDEIFFGAKKDFKPSNIGNDYDFIR